MILIEQVHPNIKEAERYRMCKAIDCQRLTPDACSHAAQNERLPVQMAVQVLYFEQLRLRSAIQAGYTHPHRSCPPPLLLLLYLSPGFGMADFR